MALINSRAPSDLSKLESLDGTNLKRWSQKLIIFFEALELDFVMFNDFVRVKSESSSASSQTPQQEVAAAALALATKAAESVRGKKFEKDNKTVRGHLLNHMSNTFFDLFINIKSTKQIWNTLEKKIWRRRRWKEKVPGGKWLKFRMVDDKPIMEQLHEYENLTAEVLNEGMKMCEILQANVLLEKFPPS